MKASSVSSLNSADRLAAPSIPPALEVAPVSTLAASLRGLAIGVGLFALSALAGIALASATVGYPIERLA